MVWMLWNMAKNYGCRPSTLLALSDPLAAFYLDRAVATFGMRVDAALEEAKNRKGSDASKQMGVSIVLSRELGINRFSNPGR